MGPNTASPQPEPALPQEQSSDVLKSKDMEYHSPEASDEGMKWTVRRRQKFAGFISSLYDKVNVYHQEHIIKGRSIQLTYSMHEDPTYAREYFRSDG